ncbi:MAG: helix-turn-helix domain-containing protein [Sphaerochaetaceae bacterium]
MSDVPGRKPWVRLGLILASIHTGSSNGLWTSIADAAEASGDTALFVFPGGRLESQNDFEYLRNSIYHLANPENLDGMISWGSSLGGTVSVPEVVRFHQQFGQLPYVTIAHKMEGHPNISFDAYQGMKSLALHCIDTHHARKIAFLRGPLNHFSAEDRFQAYLDALQERGLPCDERLVSPPSPWNEGEAALRCLSEERHLVPGRDFDTLLCASDLLMFTAARLLQKAGYRIPDDIRVAGFNDSPESRFLSVPGTTVRVPFTDMGRSAFGMIRALVGSEKTVQDKLEPASLVIRYSCGCGYRSESLVPAGESADRQSLFAWMVKAFSLDAIHVQAWLDPMAEALYSGAGERSLVKFSDILSKILERAFEQDPDPVLFQEAIVRLSRLGDLPEDYRQAACRTCWALVVEAQSRIGNYRVYESMRRSKILNSFKCDLLRAWDRLSIPKIMYAHLPLLGIQQAFLVMGADDGYARYIGGYTSQGMTTEVNELFPARCLLPDSIMPLCVPGTYLVQPLFIENEVLGYLVTGISDREGSMHEELRSSVGSALKGVLLFEETVRAKEVAEHAEQAKMDFFATMGDGLKEPLATILDKMNQLDAMIQEQSRIPKDLGKAIGSVRDEMEMQLDKTSLLFDYTLAQVGALELDMKLFPPSRRMLGQLRKMGASVECPPRLPMLQGDEDRIVQVLEILAAHFSGMPFNDLHVGLSLSKWGLSIVFTTSAGQFPAMQEDNRLALARSIVLLHFGGISFESGSVRLWFPWPNIGSLKPSGDMQGTNRMLVLGSRTEIAPGPALVAAQLGLEAVSLLADKVLMAQDEIEDGDLVFWDADIAGFEQYLALRALHQHRRLFKVPFLCYSEVLQGQNLMEAVAVKISQRNTGPLVFWGLDSSLFPLLTESQEVFSVDSPERFTMLLKECRPSMILFGSVDFNRISHVRNHPSAALTPVAVLVEHFPQDALMEKLCALPQVVVFHTCVVNSSEVASRLRDIATGGEILPSHTGALVKKALLYLEQHAAGPVSRWKIADSVNVSEDYLTRVFRKELGMSPWEYLNRYRIQLACDLLIRTNLSLNEISFKTGFQDQAYFCRVFKKLKGCTPSELRMQ